MVAFPGSVAWHPENRLAGTAPKLWGKEVCAKGFMRGRQPLSVKFAPRSTGSSAGGIRLMRNGTPGQLTAPLPLIRIESPHLECKLDEMLSMHYRACLQRINISSKTDVAQLFTGEMAPI